jgi:pimeloyl-ACP methyl ester carboxylesterase
MEHEVRMVAANGLGFETLVAGTGGSRFALLLHGFPEHFVSWRAQVEPLVRAGYEVWAPNQRGYGASSGPHGVAHYAIDHLTADAAALIDVGANGRPVTLIAHDWGAIVAWALAADRLRHLERLVVMNVPHPAVMAEGLRRPRQMLRSWYVFAFQVPGLPEAVLGANGARTIRDVILKSARRTGHFDEATLATYVANAARPGGLTAMINWYRAAMAGGFERFRRGRVLPIDVPTQMIWGEEDVALGVELTEGYQGLVSDFTLRRLPGVGHWVQQEAPDEVNAILLDWLTTPRS